MYTIAYDKALWEEAARRAAEMPILEGSHRGKRANEVGMLGEVGFEVMLHAYGVPFQYENTTRLDYHVPGHSAEVKTKDRTVPPQSHYECSVPLYNHPHQRPDLYVFASAERDEGADQSRIECFRKVHLVGWSWLHEVDELGVLRKKGETDHDNGTTFWTACLNLPISATHPVEGLMGYLASLTATPLGG